MANKLIAFPPQPTFCTPVQMLCSHFNAGLRKIKIFSHLSSTYFKRKKWGTVSEVNVYLEHWLNIHWEVKNWLSKPQHFSLCLYFQYDIQWWNSFLSCLCQFLIFSKKGSCKRQFCWRLWGCLWPWRSSVHRPELALQKIFCILKRWILTLLVGRALMRGACHITDSSLDSGRFFMFYLWEATLRQVLSRNTKTFHICHNLMQYWGFLMYSFS